MGQAEQVGRLLAGLEGQGHTPLGGELAGRRRASGQGWLAERRRSKTARDIEAGCVCGTKVRRTSMVQDRKLLLDNGGQTPKGERR